MVGTAGKAGVGGFGGVGFDRQRTLGFVEYLSLEALDSIDTFDRLSVGLNMTIEDFFTFINRLLEDEVPDKRCVACWFGPLFPKKSCTAVLYSIEVAIGRGRGGLASFLPPIHTSLSYQNSSPPSPPTYPQQPPAIPARRTTGTTTTR
jgi:hypothetical protein